MRNLLTCALALLAFCPLASAQGDGPDGVADTNVVSAPASLPVGGENVPVPTLLSDEQARIRDEEREWSKLEDESWGNLLRFRGEAEGFFYNSEYSHPLLPGYTLPGVRLEGVLRYTPHRQLALDAGYGFVAMQGRRGAFVHAPVIALTGWLSPRWSIRLGTLPDIREHGLPDFLYDPQWAWLHVPEAGARIGYRSPKLSLETWIDWAKFIWKDEEAKEHFLFGMQGDWQPAGSQHGLHLRALALAKHRGGQIDKSPLPVETSWNGGVSLGYRTKKLTSKALYFGVEGYALLGHDGTEHSPLPKRNGWMLVPILYSSLAPSVFSRLELRVAYFHGKRFQPLRGAPIYGSYSAWSEKALLTSRSILTSRVGYAYLVERYGAIRLNAGAIYDLNVSRLDWDFELSIWLKIASLD